MTPDPVSGRWLRGIAIAAFIALGVVMCTRGHRDAADPDAQRIVTLGAALQATAPPPPPVTPSSSCTTSSSPRSAPTAPSCSAPAACAPTASRPPC